MSKEKMIEIRGWASSHPRAAEQFLNEVIAAAKDGYVLHPKPTTIRQRANLVGFPTVVMVTEEYASEILSSTEPVVIIEEKPVEVSSNIVGESTKEEDKSSSTEELEALNSKDELFEFASKYNLEVPEDKKVPKAIKKWLSEQI